MRRKSLVWWNSWEIRQVKYIYIWTPYRLLLLLSLLIFVTGKKYAYKISTKCKNSISEADNDSATDTVDLEKGGKEPCYPVGRWGWMWKFFTFNVGGIFCDLYYDYIWCVLRLFWCRCGLFSLLIIYIFEVDDVFLWSCLLTFGHIIYYFSLCFSGVETPEIRNRWKLDLNVTMWSH